MIIVFRNETQHCKLKCIEQYFMNACNTWMCCERGEGEEEIDNHGRSRVKVVSSQGTICNWSIEGSSGTQDESQKANSRDSQKVQDARRTLTQLPFFLPYRIQS